MLKMIARKLLGPHALNSGFGLVTMFALTGVVASLVLVQRGIDVSPPGMF
ncbi:conserved exported protein of unknown function [Bradyrhizobium sp. ORS 285]|nr:MULTISPECIES: hypothetical protein [unclassified Bradyrhizobium]CCD84761.1 conserved exported hypothetical protein [Bradyrhizobium sp. ORS 285]SMX60926.1 conserved exported protein of unknown function [Bradyrhizobium sp. ORS 285]